MLITGFYLIFSGQETCSRPVRYAR